MQIYWHMTPFHAEVGCNIRQDDYKLPYDCTNCTRAMRAADVRHLYMQNLDMYLINEGKAWYLTDAGGFNSWLDAHADRIVQAVTEAIPAGQNLTYIICEPAIPSKSIEYILHLLHLLLGAQHCMWTVTRLVPSQWLCLGAQHCQYWSVGESVPHAPCLCNDCDEWLLGAVTHSHLDHVGAIEPLKEVYPELKVIVHETEAPFLIGGQEYSCYDYLPGGLSPGFKLLMWIRLLPPFYQYQVSHLQLTEEGSAMVVWQACRRQHLGPSPLKAFMLT